MRCIGEFDADFNTPNPTREHRKFNGDLIERWMLKIICGLVASGQVSENGTPVHIISDQLVDILFEGAEFPEGWGLYFPLSENCKIHHYGSVSILPRSGKGEVKAAEFLLNNFPFFLILGKPDNPSAWGHHRIKGIRMRKGKIVKAIEFIWKDREEGVAIDMTWAASSREAPEDWEDWMKK
ncbi:MAG: hypothetical protein OHK0019_35510 [Saprospiraceae bacterium]